MKISASAYNSWARGVSYQETESQKVCREKVRECFYLHRRRYGARRIAAELKIGRQRARLAMKREGLKAIAPKRFIPKTTDSTHDQRVSPNLLSAGANQPTGKGEVIVGDITYLPLKGGRFCYLACFQDKYTRRIIGWAIESNDGADCSGGFGTGTAAQTRRHGARRGNHKINIIFVRTFRRIHSLFLSNIFSPA